MRFHVVGLPFEPQPQCAYHGKVVRFCQMMRGLGHDVFEYQATESEWDPERQFVPESAAWRRFNYRVMGEIAAIAEPTDFLCVIAGRCQEPLAAAFPELTCVEFGVGYGGVFARFRVFESYAWMHTVYGSQAGSDPHQANGQFYDAVIPNYFNVADFPFRAHASDAHGAYYAFLGRLIDRKGAQIAADVCEHLGVDLVIAGEGTPPAYGTHVGVVGPEQRAEIMGGATAVFVPTLYIEPFGGVAVEAMLCGTPVITTDFGAFTETVIDGVTGFRCHTLAEFAAAAKHAPELDRAVIRDYAVNRYSTKVVGPMYEEYFERLNGLWGIGWSDLTA